MPSSGLPRTIAPPRMARIGARRIACLTRASARLHGETPGQPSPPAGLDDAPPGWPVPGWVCVRALGFDVLARGA